MVNKLFFGNDESSDEDDPDVVPRTEWQARPPLRIRTFADAPENVVYSETDTKSCQKKEECITLVQDIQNYHMDVRNMDDIQYNFLIGGDGNVYEGRGWDNVSGLNPRDPKLSVDMSGNPIEVAFIGEYKGNHPPKQMLKVAARLLLYGIKNNKIIVTKKTDKTMSEGEIRALIAEGKNVEFRGYDLDDQLRSEEQDEENETSNDKLKRNNTESQTF